MNSGQDLQQAAASQACLIVDDSLFVSRTISCLPLPKREREKERERKREREREKGPTSKICRLFCIFQLKSVLFNLFCVLTFGVTEMQERSLSNMSDKVYDRQLFTHRYSLALTIATLSWLVSLSPWSANFRVQKCAACLVVREPPHVHIAPILGHLHWLPVRARITLHASVSTPSLPPPQLTSLTFYICTLLLDLFAPVPTPASSKVKKVIVLFLTLVHLSGNHCC